MAISTFIEACLLTALFTAILNTNIDKSKKNLYVLSLAVTSIITMLIIPGPYNIFINYIIMFILITKLLKFTPLKTLISMCFSIIVVALLSMLILNPYLSIVGITYEILLVTPIYRITYLVFLYTIIYCIYLALKFTKFNIDMLEDYDKKTKSTIILNFVFGLITMSIQLFITFYYINVLSLIFTFLSFITLFAYFSISLYSLTKVTKLTIATQRLESAEEYNKTLRILHDNVRCFKHDFDNIVTTIGGFIRTDDMEGLKKYYIRLEDDCQKVNNLYVLNPEIINNTGVYNLLTKKYHDAESKNIKINLTFLLDLNSLKMQIYDFAKILGILLDNAIEASDESEEKTINIIFRNDEKNNRQILIIENTYKDKNIDIDRIFCKGISGKKNHTGLGLWEIREILKRNNNLNLHTTKNDKLFIQQFEIYY